VIDDATIAAFAAAGYVLTASQPVPVTGHGSRSHRKGFVSVTLHAQPRGAMHWYEGFDVSAESAHGGIESAVRAAVSRLAAKVCESGALRAKVAARRAEEARLEASVALARATTEQTNADAVHAALEPLTRAT
jgi:hypothetical protein